METGEHKFEVADVVLLGISASTDPENAATGNAFYVSEVTNESDGSQALGLYITEDSDIDILSSNHAYVVTVGEADNGNYLGNGGSKSIYNADITDSDGSASLLASIDQALRFRQSNASRMGILETRLEYTLSNLTTVNEFTQVARSQILDADFAVESARLSKSMVLRQSATAMLSQSGAQPQLVLRLLQYNL